MLIKQLTAFFLSFVLIFISTPSFAADGNQFRDPNMWQRERTINDTINKSSVNVEAQRTYPVSTLDQNGNPIKQKRTARSTIKLGANTASVGKRLFKGTAQVAVASAVYDILGKTVDWVLDPENNAVKWKDGGGGNTQYVGQLNCKTISSSPTTTCSKLATINGYPSGSKFTAGSAPTDPSHVGTCSFSGYNYAITIVAPKQCGEADTEWQRIPMPQVAQKVIDNAEAGGAEEMQVMNDTALDMLEAGLLDAQLDAASDIPQPDPEEISQADYDNSTDPETPTDPETSCPAGYKKQPDGTCLKTEQTDFVLPPFCSWASKVCDFVDWMQKDPPEDTQIELPEPDTSDVDSDVDFGGSCPDDAGFTMNIFGNDVEFVMMPFSKFCPLLETYIKPVLVVLGSFMAVTIVGGRRDG